MRKISSTQISQSLRKVASGIIKVAEDLNEVELTLGKDKAGTDNDRFAEWEMVEKRLDQPGENMMDMARAPQPDMDYENFDEDNTPEGYMALAAQIAGKNKAWNYPSSPEYKQKHAFVRKTSYEALKKSN